MDQFTDTQKIGHSRGQTFKTTELTAAVIRGLERRYAMPSELKQRSLSGFTGYQLRRLVRRETPATLTGVNGLPTSA
jgi:hypothetical protein